MGEFCIWLVIVMEMERRGAYDTALYSYRIQHTTDINITQVSTEYREEQSIIVISQFENLESSVQALQLVYRLTETTMTQVFTDLHLIPTTTKFLIAQPSNFILRLSLHLNRPTIYSQHPQDPRDENRHQSIQSHIQPKKQIPHQSRTYNLNIPKQEDSNDSIKRRTIRIKQKTIVFNIEQRPKLILNYFYIHRKPVYQR